MLFDGYLFADYSGARDRSAQRRAIRLARAVGSNQPLLVQALFTREDLVEELVGDLREASRSGKRICFGQDHQYGIPISLGRELGLADLPWRQAVESLCAGAYGPDAPMLSQAGTFGAAFNRWFESRGMAPYFFSATNATAFHRYCIPPNNPRQDDRSSYRLTELCRPSSKTGAPMPFNRLGDNGTVGGQSLVGLVALNSLLSRCRSEGIAITVWPFDGLSVLDRAYSNTHVMLIRLTPNGPL